MSSTLTWVNPTQNTDGTAYDAAAQNAGYELAFDDQEAAIALPFALGTSFDMKDLAQYEALRAGNHTVRLRVVTRGGARSEWASATFRREGTPMAVSSLAVV